MASLFEFAGVTRTFGHTIALHDVSLRVDQPSIIGLIGRNGSGKSTLLRHIVGLYLVQHGECTTLGKPTWDLGPDEFARIGVVHQRDPLLPWMTVKGILRYIESFYPRWDRDLEGSMLDFFELPSYQKVKNLSPGNLQRLGIILAVCHRPELLLLDEPLSDLDPIAREDVLRSLLERFGNEDMTIVISSHMLRDIETIVNRIVCLDKGRVVADAPLDELQERFVEWIVRSRQGNLPDRFPETFVVRSHGTRSEARVTVLSENANAEQFAQQYGAEIEQRGLNLEQIFPLLIQPRDASREPMSKARVGK